VRVNFSVLCDLQSSRCRYYRVPTLKLGRWRIVYLLSVS